LTQINADLDRAFGFGGRLGKWGLAEGRSRLFMDAEELLEKYAAGQRNFRGADLSGVDLKGAN
jgi:uncharacterized protein YjbI with pentapeptide repeats